MIINSECKEVPESWVLEQLTMIPKKYLEMLNGVFVRSAEKSNCTFPEIEYYGGDYFRGESNGLPANSIALYVPLYNEEGKYYYGLGKTAWEMEDILRYLKESLIHEIGHHISLVIVGNRFMLPTVKDETFGEYVGFYKEEERRANKLASLIEKKNWKKLDKVIGKSQQTLKTTCVATV